MRWVGGGWLSRAPDALSIGPARTVSPRHASADQELGRWVRVPHHRHRDQSSSLRAPRRSARRISLERSRPPFGGSPAATCAAFPQSCWLAFSGGNIVIRNMAGFSSRPNGPGTLWLIAGRRLRYSTMAQTSDFVSPAYARHGMMGARTRPSGLTPV